jgi:hypothetical protein
VKELEKMDPRWLYVFLLCACYSFWFFKVFSLAFVFPCFLFNESICLLVDYNCSLSFIEQDTSVLSPAIPLGLVVVPAYIIACKSEEHIFEEHPSLYIIAFGLVVAKVTNRLVVITFFFQLVT